MRQLLTIVTPASTFNLTTKEAVKLDLGITVADYDAIIDGYIAACSLQLANVCGRVFAQEAVSEKIRQDCALEHIVLARRPVKATSPAPVIAVDDETLTTADYEMDYEAGLVYRLDGQDRPIDWYGCKTVIAYTAGYALPSGVPTDLAKACNAMVKAQYLSKGRDPLVRSESVPGVYEVAYWVGQLPGAQQWPNDILTAINAYRDPLIGSTA